MNHHRKRQQEQQRSNNTSRGATQHISGQQHNTGAPTTKTVGRTAPEGANNRVSSNYGAFPEVQPQSHTQRDNQGMATTEGEKKGATIHEQNSTGTHNPKQKQQKSDDNRADWTSVEHQREQVNSIQRRNSTQRRS